MKKLVVLLCLLSVFVVGCSAENLSEDRAENMPESAENAGLAEEAAYIELAHMENYANFYELTFHKREVNTGGRLFFQGTQKDSDEFLLPEETGLYGWKFENADGTEAEPAGDSVDQIYWYDRGTGLADAVTVQFWNREPAASCEVMLEGLTCKVELPQADFRRIPQDQELLLRESGRIESVDIYPDAYVVELSGISTSQKEDSFLLLDRAGHTKCPLRTVYDAEKEGLSLLYADTEGLDGEELSLLIGRLGEYDDYALALE